MMLTLSKPIPVTILSGSGLLLAVPSDPRESVLLVSDSGHVEVVPKMWVRFPEEEER